MKLLLAILIAFGCFLTYGHILNREAERKSKKERERKEKPEMEARG